MKKFVFLSFSLLVVCMHSFAANVPADFPISSESCGKDLHVVNVCNLSDQQLNEIMQGRHPEIIVEFAAQTFLPISFFLKGDLLNLVESEEKFRTIEIKQSFYVRCVGQELIFSSNLTDWRPLPEFITGTASVALSIQDGQPSFVVGAEVNRRS
jgi:hypothetical protein